jgi:hypothetical protein
MRKNNVGLEVALGKIPYATVKNVNDAFYVTANEFSVCVRKYSAERVKTAKQLWDEDRSSTPSTVEHFSFRKMVSDTLFDFAVAVGEIKMKRIDPA